MGGITAISSPSAASITLSPDRYSSFNDKIRFSEITDKLKKKKKIDNVYSRTEHAIYDAFVM
jgi:hypothetical protein